MAREAGREGSIARRHAMDGQTLYNTARRRKRKAAGILWWRRGGAGGVTWALARPRCGLEKQAFLGCGASTGAGADRSSGVCPRCALREASYTRLDRATMKTEMSLRDVLAPLKALRIAVTGLLMGTANLIPGVSGGTMVLVMGLYEDFIEAVAEVTSLRLRPARLAFLAVLLAAAGLAIVFLASVILYLLFIAPSFMFALFIGLTLGGTPALLRMIGRVTVSCGVALVAGLAVMAVVAFTTQAADMPRNMAMDFASGVIGTMAMVLPGISGSYMLLVLNQYDRVIGAVDDLRQMNWSALRIVIPVGVGVVVGMAGIANALRYLLRRHEKATLGFLMGLLLGSVLGLWPFGRAPTEKILEKRSPEQLRAYAESIGLPAAAGLEGRERIDHLLVAWSLTEKSPVIVARKHSEAMLRAFAEREGLAVPADVQGVALAQHIARSWQPLRKGSPPPREVAGAVFALVLGFAATALLGRLAPEG